MVIRTWIDFSDRLAIHIVMLMYSYLVRGSIARSVAETGIVLFTTVRALKLVAMIQVCHLAGYL